eukprot:scaffold502_cov115-Isochrysis_galbana.AAC.13
MECAHKPSHAAAMNSSIVQAASIRWLGIRALAGCLSTAGCRCPLAPPHLGAPDDRQPWGLELKAHRVAPLNGGRRELSTAE